MEAPLSKLKLEFVLSVEDGKEYTQREKKELGEIYLVSDSVEKDGTTS